MHFKHEYKQLGKHCAYTKGYTFENSTHWLTKQENIKNLSQLSDRTFHKTYMDRVTFALTNNIVTPITKILLYFTANLYSNLTYGNCC